jgi:hypothetical protein
MLSMVGRSEYDLVVRFKVWLEDLSMVGWFGFGWIWSLRHTEK